MTANILTPEIWGRIHKKIGKPFSIEFIEINFEKKEIHEDHRFLAKVTEIIMAFSV